MHMKGEERKNTICAIVLAGQEEMHIARCLDSLHGICEEIVVVDCFSDDRTREIAKQHGAMVLTHEWRNYAEQFNWALNNAPITANWVWRIDADEYLDGGLGLAVKNAIADCKDDINGVYVRRLIKFLGRPLMHGGWYPTYHLKVFRRGFGECENRWMDEHIILKSGKTITVNIGNQVDDNHKSLTWWTNKHNSYATRQVVDLLMMEYGLDDRRNTVQPKLLGTEEQRKRWLEMKYLKAPLFVRPLINFFLRYIIKGGFRDGKEGLVWHFLQGFWYRFLVDAKIFELRRQFNFDDERIKEYIVTEYHL